MAKKEVRGPENAIEDSFRHDIMKNNFLITNAVLATLTNMPRT